jgi:hypothetical protein
MLPKVTHGTERVKNESDMDKRKKKIITINLRVIVPYFQLAPSTLEGYYRYERFEQIFTVPAGDQLAHGHRTPHPNAAGSPLLSQSLYCEPMMV